MASDQVLGIAILAVVVAVLLSTVIYARRYKKVPPGKAMVVFGKPEKGGRGYRVISGGGKLIVPIVESIEWLDLKIHRLDLALTDVVADFRGVRELLALRAVAEVKIGSDETSLNAAAESLLGKSDGELKEIASKTIEGHLRDSCASLPATYIDSNRDEFASQVMEGASDDLQKAGLEIRSLVITSVELSPRAVVHSLGKLAGLEAQVTAPIRPGFAGRVAIATEDVGISVLEAVSDETIGSGARVMVHSIVAKVHKI